ncbi:MAG: hypothetical protein PF439_00025 [Helicobacteraceae bacterium]|nr:hypothetical protein [Helicobacteraceae bacterium]
MEDESSERFDSMVFAHRSTNEIIEILDKISAGHGAVDSARDVIKSV